MNVDVILFSAGSAGNFLARVLSLDTTTVPLGALTDYNDVERRFNHYDYSRVIENIGTDFNNFLTNGLSKWVNYELNKMFFPLTRGIPELIKLNLRVIEPIHPQQLNHKMALLGKDDNINFSYIDITECIEWVTKQQIHKGAYKKFPTTHSTLDDLKNVTKCAIENNATSINLKNIILSEESFLKEYQKICAELNIKNYDLYAIGIYRSWKETWA